MEVGIEAGIDDNADGDEDVDSTKKQTLSTLSTAEVMSSKRSKNKFRVSYRRMQDEISCIAVI